MPPPSRSPRTAELRKMNSHRSSRSSESRLMLESENNEDVDDLFLFTEMKKHESEITYFSARQSERRDSPKASVGGKNEYNWLLTPPGSPLNDIDRELKPVDNPRNKARTQTTTTPRPSTNGKTQTRDTVATSPRDAKREPSRRLSSGNTKAKEKRNDIVCVGCTNSHLCSFDLISVIEEEPFPAKGASEQNFGGLVNSGQEEGAQETLVDTSKHEKACGDANLMSATQKSRFAKDVLDQNAHVCPTKSETAAELSKTAEAPRNFTSEEATDAILLCNSIVHDLVYESAAIESENQMALTEISRPSLEQLVKSASDLKYFRYVYYKRNKNLQRFNRKKQEFDTKKALSDLRTDAKSKEHVKPPKIESKCNCSIM
ncbi:uncharacterized protein LOC121977013 isoform X1 [Zingiber officinale]|uniref:uncharacterized protein LOC121977013 isoform X1 n=1 Tax=Zingiber officinale TaxID=94328 RepID=UPI001C4BBC2C|nr:uncharacterized protein LOC121977013 isoform X1 [Zingiber officinale]